MVCIGFHFTLPLLRLGLFISTTADADPIVVLGFAVLLVGQVRKIQAALFIDRLALLIQTGRAALPRPIDTGPSTFPGYQRVGGPVRSPSRRLSTRNSSPRAGACGDETRMGVGVGRGGLGRGGQTEFQVNLKLGLTPPAPRTPPAPPVQATGGMGEPSGTQPPWKP